MACSENKPVEPPQNINKVSVTLNGGNYSNETLVLETPDIINGGAFVYDSSNSIFLNLYGAGTLNSFSLTGNISGTDTGSYNFIQNETYIEISMPQRFEKFYMLSGEIEVNKVDNPGGFVASNFFGDYFSRTAYDTISISGTFYLQRKESDDWVYP